MDHHQKVIRASAAALILAISLRLLGGGILNPLAAVLQKTAVQSFLIYLQTGRVVRQPQPALPEQTAPPSEATEPAIPHITQPETLQKPVFSEADLERVSMLYRCDYRPELEPLITAPLSWDLTGGAPTVLIVHTHATESYTKSPGEEYEETVTYRTLDEGYNMVSIGAEVARVLTAGGISVLHDRGYHDYPSYNGSYANARVTIQEYLRKYPSIQLVLDIHRDASDGSDGSQLSTSATVGGQPASQLLVMVGTDAQGNYHPNWQENLSLALKLSAQLERADPGVTRPVTLRGERFNTDLTAGSLLIEVGGAGDTHSEALLAANALARGILALARGTQ